MRPASFSSCMFSRAQAGVMLAAAGVGFAVALVLTVPPSGPVLGVACLFLGVAGRGVMLTARPA